MKPNCAGMEDFDGSFIHIRRSVWRTHTNETKTPASQSMVPVIHPLKALLDEHRYRVGRSTGWMFAGPKNGFSLNLDNLVKRTIRPTLGEKWKGWHALRRGLRTNLFKLGIPAETAQIILRHESVDVTRKHYIKLQAAAEGAAAMKKLGRLVGQRWGKSQAVRTKEIAETSINSGEFVEPTARLELATCRLRILGVNVVSRNTNGLGSCPMLRNDAMLRH